jgi:hypothetical protein
MNLRKVLRERILSVFGVLLVAAAIDGLLSPEFFVYSSPLLGGVAPRFSGPALVKQIVAITDWPFFVPLFIGCILIGIDVYYYFTKNKVKIE